MISLDMKLLIAMWGPIGDLFFTDRLGSAQPEVTCGREPGQYGSSVCKRIRFLAPSRQYCLWRKISVKWRNFRLDTKITDFCEEIKNV